MRLKEKCIDNGKGMYSNSVTVVFDRKRKEPQLETM